MTGTPAAILREAASRMRELAEAATPGPWRSWNDGHVSSLALDEKVRGTAYGRTVMPATGCKVPHEVANAAHIAAWHPSVALAVANWLDEVAALIEFGSELNRAGEVGAALNVARVFLGTDR